MGCLLMITVALSAIRVPSAVAIYDNVKFARHDFGLPALRGRAGFRDLVSTDTPLERAATRVVPRPWVCHVPIGFWVCASLNGLLVAAVPARADWTSPRGSDRLWHCRGA